MVLPGLLFQSRMVRLTHEMQGAGNRTAKLLFEAVHDHETLTTQRGEARFQRLWDELVALMALKSSQQRNLTTALTTWAGAVQQGTNIVAVMIGTYQVFAGNYTVGTIIAIGMLSSRTLAPLSQLSAMVVRWTNVKAALTALDAIAAAPQSEDAGTRYLRRETFAGTYEMQRCAFRYDPQGALALDLPALSIPAGQHVAVLGANGSGKSTLLRVMAGLALPETGRVLLDGCDLAQISMRDLRRGVGYLGQEVRLFSGTLRDNLNLTQIERDDARLMAALDFAGLGAFLRGHPRGLDLEIAEGGLGLSVGQRQSLGWARLWLQDPTVVLLDEPTAAMDQTLEAMMVRRLGPWLRGRTAIIATHRVPLLQLVSRTVILQSGRIAVDGPRDEVLARLAQAQGAQVAQVAG
ncbi:MAG: ATP-binding cassette domain-containing protein, partial [Rhodobacteraceae bacterium]|nr:ATP-binding cassette domain-containing protein [Paracoccaceae bacterium]